MRSTLRENAQSVDFCDKTAKICHVSGDNSSTGQQICDGNSKSFDLRLLDHFFLSGAHPLQWYLYRVSMHAGQLIFCEMFTPYDGTEKMLLLRNSRRQRESYVEISIDLTLKSIREDIEFGSRPFGFGRILSIIFNSLGQMRCKHWNAGYWVIRHHQCLIYSESKIGEELCRMLSQNVYVRQPIYIDQ